MVRDPAWWPATFFLLGSEDRRQPQKANETCDHLHVTHPPKEEPESVLCIAFVFSIKSSSIMKVFVLLPQDRWAGAASVGLRRPWAGACKGPGPRSSPARRQPPCARAAWVYCLEPARHSAPAPRTSSRPAHFLVSPTDRMNPVQGGAKGGRRVLISEVAKAGESISYVVGCLLCGNPTSLSSVPSCQPKSPTQGAAISAGLCSRRRRRIRGAAPPPPCDDSAPPSAATSLPSCPSRSARGRALATLARSARQFAGAARLDENAPPWVSCGGRASGAALRGGGGRGGGSHPPCPPCPPSPPVSRPSSP